MASSKVMASSNSTNSDLALARQPSTYSLSIGDLQQNDQTKNLGSMSMDELIRNIYGDNPTPPPPPSPPKNVGNKTVDEVWKEISGNNGETEGEGEEDMKIPQMVGPVHGFVVDPALDTRYAAVQPSGEGSGSILWLGNGGDKAGGGRGKRRAVLEPIDKAAQQRQRRMIKNRESAARSRERKQAYTVELETLVMQLEEDNSAMHRQRAQRNRERYKQNSTDKLLVREKDNWGFQFLSLRVGSEILTEKPDFSLIFTARSLHDHEDVEMGWVQDVRIGITEKCVVDGPLE